MPLAVAGLGLDVRGSGSNPATGGVRAFRLAGGAVVAQAFAIGL
ncbi:hypothetical protein [Rubrobacter marinus]|nr:hypothetical protein [Rubrobacter marinus]